MNSVVLSPDDKTLLAGFTTGLKVLNINTLQEIPSFIDQGENILELKFSKAGDLLAILTRNEVQLYSWPSQELISTIHCVYENTIYTDPDRLAFSPDGKTLVAVIDGSLVKMDTSTGAETYRVEDYNIEYAFFSEDGTKLIEIKYDFTAELIVIVDPSTMEELNTFELEVNTYNMVISSDHKYLAAPLTAKDEIDVFDLETGETVGTINKSSFPGVNIVSISTYNKILFSPDSKLLLFQYYDVNTVLLWDIAAKVPVQEQVVLKNYENNFTFSEDGSWLFGFGESGYTVWKTADWQMAFQEKDIRVSKILFPSQDAYLLVTDHVLEYDYTTLEEDIDFSTYYGFQVKQYEPDLVSYEVDATIRHFDTLDEETILSINDNGIQIRSKEELNVIREIAGSFTTFDISEDRTSLAVLLPDNSIQLYSLPDLQPVRQLTGQESIISGLFLQSKGQYLVSTSENDAILWNCQTGELIAMLTDIKDILDIQFSGSSIIGVQKDLALYVWTPGIEEPTESFLNMKDRASGIQLINSNGEYSFLLAKEGLFEIRWGSYPDVFSRVEISIDDSSRMAFSDSGERLAVSLPDGIQVFDNVNWEVQKMIPGSYSAFSFVPGTLDLMVASGNQILIFPDLVTATASSNQFNYFESMKNPQYIEKSSPYFPAGIESDGDLIDFPGAYFGLITYYDAETGLPVGMTTDDSLSGYSQDPYFDVATAFSPDGKNLAKLVSDGYGKVYLQMNPVVDESSETTTSPEPLELPGANQNNLSLSVSNTGKVAVYNGDYSNGFSITLIDGLQLKILKTINLGQQNNQVMAISPDGNTLAYLFKVADDYRFQLKVLDISAPNAPSEKYSIDQDEIGQGAFGITILAYDQSGKYLVAGGDDGSIVVLDALTLEILSSHDGHSSNITGLLFYPDGKMLLSSSADGTIRLWGVTAWGISQ